MNNYNILRKLDPSINRMSDEITKVNIQDVADFYYMGCDKEVFLIEDYQTCVPPWVMTYLEWRIPDFSYSKEMGTTPLKSDKSFYVGHLVTNMHIKEKVKIPKNYGKYIDETSREIVRNTFGILTQDEGIEGYDVGWIVYITTYCFTYSYEQISTSGFFLAKDGRPIILNRPEQDKVFIPMSMNTKYPNFEKNFKRLHQMCVDLNKIALMAFTFCNCKNIEIVENLVSRQVRRNLERHNQPIEKFYTLEIKSMRRIIDKIRIEHNTGIKKALHLCRGHFKTYTAENPLLGKFTGTYWWDMHTRGNKEYGTINKDYLIKK